MKLVFPLAAALALAGCVTYDTRQGDGIPRARIGQGIDLRDFEVMPQQVLEDSRCPTGVQCVSQGQLRLRVRVDLPDGVVFKDMTLGEQAIVAGGTLELAEATPHPEDGQTIYPEDYRFGFRYARPALD